jgi:hypothetical protein
MNYYPLVSETYWVIGIESVTLGDAHFKDLKGVVDTGTSVIVGPKNMIAELTKAIPSQPDCKNLS